MSEMKPIHEMIPILYQWQLAKYTTVQSFAFWNVRVKLYNFRVSVYNHYTTLVFPFIKGLPSHGWHDTHL